LCLECSDLNHLLFLPSGNMALTLRAKKYSRLWAVVLKWSRARKQYERQGLLVEVDALAKAEQECLADSEVRERRRDRASLRRAELDEDFVRAFAQRIRESYPGCPAGREQVIAERACEKYSGRVGRSAPAKQFDDEAIRLAVVAHVRHTETNYGELLCRGIERIEARENVWPRVDEVLSQWSRR